MKALIQLTLACVFCAQLSSHCFTQSMNVKSHPISFATADTEEFSVSVPAQYTLNNVAANVSQSPTAAANSSGPGGDGGPAIAAQLNKPAGIAVDSAGNLYIADSGNHRIRKVTPAGIISTVAGGGTGRPSDGGQATAAWLVNPIGLAVDSAGNIYFADNRENRIYKVTTAGIISAVAGNGTMGFSGDGGAATAAQLSYPYNIAVDSAGNIYIADAFNNRIRKVTPAGIISTFAGGGAGRSPDGSLATATWLFNLSGIAVDSADNLYVADIMGGRIRKVTPAGIISTVTGKEFERYTLNEMGMTSNEERVMALAPSGGPCNLAFDSAGNLYFADMNHQIRKITPAGKINIVAGPEGIEFGNGGGLDIPGRLGFPSDVAVDSAGNLYTTGTNRILKITTSGTINTVAGNGTIGYGADGEAATAVAIHPTGVAVDSAGNLYIADNSANKRIRKVSPAGIITTVAGGGTGKSGDGNPATAAFLSSLSGVAVDSANNLYIIEAATKQQIRKVATDGKISTVAGNGNLDYKVDRVSGMFGGPINRLSGMVVDSAGNIYVAFRDNHRICKITPASAISTVAGNETKGYGGDGGPAAETQLNTPYGVAVDSAGNLYISDAGNHRIRKVTPSGIISTIAGNGTKGFSGDGGQAVSAQLNDPRGIAVDSAGNLYIADGSNCRIRKVTPAGIISTVAGNTPTLRVCGYSGDGGPATAAQLNGPADVTVDSAGNLYFVDAGNCRIRKVTPAGIISTAAGNGVDSGPPVPQGF